MQPVLYGRVLYASEDNFSEGLDYLLSEDNWRGKGELGYDYVKNNLREELGKYLFQKTRNRPIVLPVLIEV